MPTRYEKIHQLTIYLVKDPNAADNELIKVVNAKPPVNIELPEATAQLYVRKHNTSVPEWSTLLLQSEQVSPNIFDQSASTGAILIVRIGSNAFLVSFGLGHTLHNPEAIVRDFGLRVAINSCKPSEIRSTDKATNELTPLNSRTQSSLGVEIEDLLIDIETDLLYAITGSSEVDLFGKIVTGRDSLTIKPKLELNKLPRILKKASERYVAKLPYEFKWVDNIRREKDASVTTQLDEELRLGINRSNNSKIWLGEPEIVDWENTLGYSFTKKGNVFPILDIQRLKDFIVANSKPISAESLRTTSIYCIDASHMTIKQWTAYRCIYAEVMLNGDTYILRSGVWYKVAADFVNRINNSIINIPRYSVALMDFDHANENDYNTAVAASDPKIESLDRDTISFGGSYSKIEVCDLIREGKDLIHVKKYSGSQTLSHLFNQGLVSAETLKKSAEFRSLFNGKIPAHMRLADPDQDLQQDHYQVVYAIYSDKNLPLDLPFFSKITLKNAFQNLKALGFRVSLANINISSRLKSTTIGGPSKGPRSISAA